LLRHWQLGFQWPLAKRRYRQWHGQLQQSQQQLQFPVLQGLRSQPVALRSPQFDKEQAGPARSALAQATIPELKFVPRFRKARPPRPPSARRSPFPKRSPAFPRVRRPPIRALVLLGRFLQRLRPLAQALAALSELQFVPRSRRTRLSLTWSTDMLAFL